MLVFRHETQNNSEPADKGGAAAGAPQQSGGGTQSANSTAQKSMKNNSPQGANQSTSPQTGIPANSEKQFDPIDMATGAFLYEDKDFILPEMTWEFALIRRYSSLSDGRFRESIGRKWSLSVDACVCLDGEIVVVKLPDGKAAEFDFRDGYYHNRRGTHKQYTLQRPEENFIFRDNINNITYTFDGRGKLKVISDRQGNETRFTYGIYGIEKAELSTGLSLTFTWKDMKVARVEDNAGRAVEYRYDRGILKEVMRCDGTVISYTYDEEDNLLTVTDGNGCTYLFNEYDDKNRVTRQRLTDGASALFSYDDINRTNTFYDETNDITICYTYDEKKDIVRVAYEDGTCEDTELENGLIVKETNRLGASTVYTRDEYGRIVTKKEPSGLITTYTYREWDLVKVTDNEGRYEEYTYDENGNVKVSRIQTGRDKYQEKRYTYDEKGRVTAVEENGVLTERYVYRTGHNSPSEIRRCTGAVIYLKYDDCLRLVEKETEGVYERYEYTPYNRLISHIDGEGGETRLYYDNSWRLIKKVTGENNRTHTMEDAGEVYTYDDLDKLAGITDETGRITEYSYNTNGDILEVKRDGQTALRYEYDKDFNPIRRHVYSGDTVSTERYFYDACGNVTRKIPFGCYDTETDEGKGYVFIRDSAGRILEEYNPEGFLTDAYTYDKRGNVTVHKHSFTRENSALNEALKASEQAGDLYTYDCRGKMVEKRQLLETTGDGILLYGVTTYSYDAAERLTGEYTYLQKHRVDQTPTGEVRAVTRAYDEVGRLVKISDNTGAEIVRTYDSRDNLIRESRKVEEGRREILELSYDNCGRIVEKVQKESRTVIIKEAVSPASSAGGRRNRFLTMAEAEARIPKEETQEQEIARTTASYDKGGRLVSITFPGGRVERTVYDAAGRRIKVSAEDRQTGKVLEIAYTYDACGFLAEKNENGIVTRYRNDIQGNCVEVVTPDGGCRTLSYDAEGRLVKEVSPRENAEGKDTGITYIYDSCGRLVKQISPYGVTLQELKYDFYGNTTEKRLADGEHIRYAYDFAGRRTVAELGDTIREEYSYNAAGSLMGSATGKEITAYERDSWGRVTGVRAPEGVTEAYRYDHKGNIIKATDGAGNTTRYQVNTFGMLDSMTHGDGMTEHFAYDREGRLTSHTLRSGKKVSYSYDAFGNLTRQQGENNVNEYTYNDTGRLESAKSEGITYRYSYDSCGRLEEKSACGRSLIRYTYDLNGNVETVTDATGKETRYLHDIENRLLSVEEAGKTLASYSYTRGGKVAGITSGDIETSYTYDSAGNTTVITTTVGGELFGTLTYRYDDRGNCIHKSNGSQNITYTYDGVNRLTGEERAEGSASTKYLYSYDKAGNRMSMELLGTDNRQHVEYTYNSLNQLTMLKDRTHNTESIFTYDKDGNLTADNCGIYSYDDFNHMTRAEMNNGDLFICRYDAEGLRHEAEENGKLIQYIYSGRNVVVEETEEESIRYIRGNGRLIVSDSDRARCYYHYVSDQLGSVNYVLDGDITKSPTDRIKCHYEYDAFGNTIVCEESIRNPFRFTGEQYDAVTNLYYLRARYYNPVIGRFTQQDTYLGDGLNLYTYVQNNPVKYVDPSGHAKQHGVGKDGYDSDLGPGEFYIDDWTGYPDAPKPEGPFRILEGAEYDEARKIANKTNAKIHRDRPDLKGKQIHEMHPVKLGGSPTDIDNKIALPPKEHAKYTSFWNKVLREQQKGK